MRAVLGACAMALCAAGAAVGAAERARVALAPGWAEAGGAHVAGLTIALADGWKTYWRSPGEAGVPPVFDWTASRNLAAVEVTWPAPEIFESFGLTTIGYDRAVTLPLRVTPADPARPVELRLGFDFGVCADVCVPERAELALDLPPEPPGAPGGPIAAALARAPLDGAEAGIVRAVCGLEGAGAGRRFAARIDFDRPPPTDALLVVEGPTGLWVGPPETRAEGASLMAEAEAQLFDPGAWIGRDAFVLTLIGRDGSIEQKGCVGPAG